MNRKCKSKEKKGERILWKHIMKYKLLECNAEGGSEKSMTLWIREKDLKFYSKLHLIWKQKNS